MDRSPRKTLNSTYPFVDSCARAKSGERSTKYYIPKVVLRSYRHHHHRRHQYGGKSLEARDAQVGIMIMIISGTILGIVLLFFFF